MQRLAARLKRTLPVIDPLVSPLVFISAIVMKGIRKAGVSRMRVSRGIFNSVGCFPIRDHYYEPLFQPKYLRLPTAECRTLPGLDLNVKGQLRLMRQFNFREELLAIPIEKKREVEFYYHNGVFESGDAEYFYNIIRRFKPARIVEVGCGHSTLLARRAIAQNKFEDGSYECKHSCIEPYENPWLEKLAGIEVVRQRIEELDLGLFTSLRENDILFLDSSHVIRPQGDVLHEFLTVLPTLQPGVLVHVHDIFTPRDYPYSWIAEEVRFFNEQYLLEAFLSFNHGFKVLGSLNFLAHEHPAEIGRACPILQQEIGTREPGSFWMVRTNSLQPTPSEDRPEC